MNMYSSKTLSKLLRLPVSGRCGFATMPPAVIEPAKLSAFMSRTGLSFSAPQILKEALTHKSFMDKNDMSHGRLQLMGQSALDLFATEYVLTKHPQLPADAAAGVVKTFLNTSTLSHVGRQLNLQSVMLWKNWKGASNGVGEPLALKWVVESLIGAIYQDKGAKAAKDFIHAHVLSRSVDIESHVAFFLKMRQPRQLLVALSKKMNKPMPIARLLKETGRISENPIFIVGMYSGVDKIGEGYGSSLKMAETRAIKDALMKHYAIDIQEVNLPSKDLDNVVAEDTLSFFEKEAVST